MYRSDLDTRDKGGAIAAVVAIHALLLFAVLHQWGDAIVQAAEKGQVYLVVMGSHGQGALSNLVMGSVATRVLASCTVPVLLVR